MCAVPGKSREATLKDVAAATGFSVAAVSYALRGGGHLKASSREAIARAAERLGYRPNWFAARLRAQRWHRKVAGFPIALLTWHANGGVYPVDPVREALEVASKERGFCLELLSFMQPRELRSSLRVLFYRGVRGLVMSAVPQLEQWEGVDWNRFSLVVCGRWSTVPRAHNVREDVFSAVVTVADVLAERGYKRIGAALCRHPVRVLDDVEREGAWAGWQARGMTDTAVPPFLGGHMDMAGFAEWFRTHRPEAVIGFSDAHFFTLREMQVRIPRDVAYVSLQATTRPGEVAALADVNGAIGRASLSLLENLIRQGDSGLPEQPQTLLVRPAFAPGQSLPEVARAKKKRPRGQGTLGAE